MHSYTYTFKSIKFIYNNTIYCGRQNWTPVPESYNICTYVFNWFLMKVITFVMCGDTINPYFFSAVLKLFCLCIYNSKPYSNVNTVIILERLSCVSIRASFILNVLDIVSQVFCKLFILMATSLSSSYVKSHLRKLKCDTSSNRVLYCLDGFISLKLPNLKQWNKITL